MCDGMHTKGDSNVQNQGVRNLLHIIVASTEMDSVFKVAADFTVPITLMQSFWGSLPYSPLRTIDEMHLLHSEGTEFPKPFSFPCYST